MHKHVRKHVHRLRNIPYMETIAKIPLCVCTVAVVTHQVPWLNPDPSTCQCQAAYLAAYQVAYQGPKPNLFMLTDFRIAVYISR